MLLDLEEWIVSGNGQTQRVAKQNVSNIKSIWLTVDEKMLLQPNKLVSFSDLEDRYFLPIFSKMKENTRKPKEF